MPLHMEHMYLPHVARVMGQCLGLPTPDALEWLFKWPTPSDFLVLGVAQGVPGGAFVLRWDFRLREHTEYLVSFQFNQESSLTLSESIREVGNIYSCDTLETVSAFIMDYAHFLKYDHWTVDRYGSQGFCEQLRLAFKRLDI